MTDFYGTQARPHPVAGFMMKPAFGVFEGGGIKGIALAGAAAAVLDAGYRFERVAGASAGALTASLIAADYTADELRQQVARINWPSLLDGVPGLRIPLLGKHVAFLRRGASIAAPSCSASGANFSPPRAYQPSVISNLAGCGWSRWISPTSAA